MDPNATGYSLWLTPTGPVQNRLSALIEDLSRRHHTPPFPPHVTLLGGISTPRGEPLAAARQLAETIAPFELTFAGIAWRDIYFQCLFIDVEPSPELLTAGTAARHQLGMSEKPFHPHLSLLYGQLALHEKQALKHELDHRYPRGFRVDHIDVYSTEGRPAHWHFIASVPLKEH